jgi:RNA polymerase sigma-70 factor (ECF subfamily)
MSKVVRQCEQVNPAAQSFDDVVVPHLDAAHRLARWLMRNEHDAEDAVQEASLRAFRYFRTFTGGNGRAWFLRIVRNTCGSWRGDRLPHTADAFDEERYNGERLSADPEMLLLQSDAAAAIEDAIDHLPARLRELLVQRELNGLSYRELADALNIPMGSVMSGLSRARDAFRGALLVDAESPLHSRTRSRETRTAASGSRAVPAVVWKSEPGHQGRGRLRKDHFYDEWCAGPNRCYDRALEPARESPCRTP